MFEEMRKFFSGATDAAMLDAITLALIADRIDDEEERVAAKAVLKQLPGFGEMDDEELDEELEASMRRIEGFGSFEDAARDIAERLGETHKKEQAFAAAAIVSFADGDFAPEEDELLGLLGDAFGLSSDRRGELLEEIAAGAADAV